MAVVDPHISRVEMPILLAVKRGPESNGSVHFETDATSTGR
jgi:hypothetical protein